MCHDGDTGNDHRPGLAAYAKKNGVKYFMISFTDLFGGQRAKLVPAQAIADMQEEGAGFAGFATWLDMTPAHPDMLAVPDPASVIQLPWKPEVAWVAANCVMEDEEVAQAPRNVLQPLIARGRRGRAAGQDRRGGGVLPADAGRNRDFRPVRYGRKALLRPAGGDAPL
jgi:hypothetical protein